MNNQSKRQAGAASGPAVTRRLIKEILEQATRHRRACSLKKYLVQDLLIIESIAIRALGHRPSISRRKVKKCPQCGSRKVIVFTADDDICEDCHKWFPGT